MLLECETITVNLPANILFELIAMAQPESHVDHAVLAAVRRYIDQAEEQARTLGNVRQLWNEGVRRI